MGVRVERRAVTVHAFRRLAPVAIVWLVVLAVTTAGAPRAQPQAQVPRLEPAECTTPELLAANAECYRFFGQEDRDSPNGTIVELPVAVMAPDHGPAPPHPDPVVYFPGGPGLSPMRAYVHWLRTDAATRTLVLIDHRGFFNSEPTLSCPDIAMSPYQNRLAPSVVSTNVSMERLRLHAETVERCYDKLVAEGIDVTKYNEYDIARDVDEIRELLGYDKINAYGYSTGGGSVIAYLRYFPATVRSIVLLSPWFGEIRNRAAIDEFYTIKQVYTDILGLCVASDPHCRELIPAWYYEIDRVRRILDDRPHTKTVQMRDGSTVTMSFDGVAFMGRLYRRFETIYMKLPNVLSRVQKGDYSALDDFFEADNWAEVETDNYGRVLAGTDARFVSGLPVPPMGTHLAHICGDMGANRPTKEDVIAMVEREPALLAFEDAKICAWWGADGAVPPEHNDRFHSDIPGLSLHGQVDVCCSPRWGQYVARTMPNLQIIELQGQRHGLPGECRPKLVSAFLEDPYAKVDDSCKNDVPLGPWVYQ